MYYVLGGVTIFSIVTIVAIMRANKIFYDENPNIRVQEDQEQMKALTKINESKQYTKPDKF